METYSVTEFAKIGIDSVFVQDNHSKSKQWVLRGLHFQSRKPQAKLVRVTAGSVYDVVVDLRVGSPTFGKWQGFVLAAGGNSMLFIPRGFAHGFLTLEDDTEFLYKCDDVYDPGYEGGIRWDDATLQIDWSQYFDEYDFTTVEVSAKDRENPTFQDYLDAPIF
jgi:dTDP-4-dehydrorhamnose 3,5-epimerase